MSMRLDGSWLPKRLEWEVLGLYGLVDACSRIEEPEVSIALEERRLLELL